MSFSDGTLETRELSGAARMVYIALASYATRMDGRGRRWRPSEARTP